MKYCKYCGTALNDNERCACPEATQAAQKTKKMIKLAVPVAAIVIVVILAVSVIPAVISGMKKADPALFISEPVFSGYNTRGEASVSFDENALIESIIGEMPEDIFSEEFVEWQEAYYTYLDGIAFSCTEGDLSNGDTFTVTITTTGRAAEKIESVALSYTVSDLKEAEIMDVFQYVAIGFDGISGEATTDFIYMSDDAAVLYCDYDIDKPYGLSNGDVITITITNTDDLLNNFGIIPAESSKQYTVSGLGWYPTADELQMDNIWEIANQFVAKIQAKNDEEGYEDFSYSDASVYGIYFAEDGNDGRAWNNNELHILAGYDFYNKGVYQWTHYEPFVFKNIVTNADGDVMLQYEDGEGSILSYSDAEEYVSELEDEYIVTKVG